MFERYPRTVHPANLHKECYVLNALHFKYEKRQMDNATVSRRTKLSKVSEIHAAKHLALASFARDH